MTLAEDRVVGEYTDHGFHRVVVRRDEPNFKYPIHYHAYDLAFQIISGSMEIDTNHHRTTLNPGDHVFIPANQLHAVRMGPQGCVYVHAEKEPAASVAAVAGE